MIEGLIKGDTLILECNLGEDMTSWQVRAELWDDITGGVDIKKATTNSGGSDNQIEITDATGGVFLIKIDKGETTDIASQANLEIELETNEGKIYTVYQSVLRFVTEKINWTTP